MFIVCEQRGGTDGWFICEGNEHEQDKPDYDITLIPKLWRLVNNAEGNRLRILDSSTGVHPRTKR